MFFGTYGIMSFRTFFGNLTRLLWASANDGPLSGGVSTSKEGAGRLEANAHSNKRGHNPTW